MDDEPLNCSPIFEFNRPHLYMGGDRELVLSSLLLSFILIVILQNILAAIMGLGLAFSSIWAFRTLAKSDPSMRHIFMRSRKYQAFYPAFSTKQRK